MSIPCFSITLEKRYAIQEILIKSPLRMTGRNYTEWDSFIRTLNFVYRNAGYYLRTN